MVLIMSVRRACLAKKSLRRKHLILSDNMSCLGAFEKERALRVVRAEQPVPTPLRVQGRRPDPIVLPL